MRELLAGREKRLCTTRLMSLLISGVVVLALLSATGCFRHKATTTQDLMGPVQDFATSAESQESESELRKSNDSLRTLEAESACFCPCGAQSIKDCTETQDKPLGRALEVFQFLGAVLSVVTSLLAFL